MPSDLSRAPRPARGRRLALLAAAAVAIVLLITWTVRIQHRLARLAGAGAAALPSRPDTPQPDLPTPAPVPVASQLADDLGRPDGDVHADLRIVAELFRQYRSTTHQLNPVGENREITAALTGHNVLNFAFLPADHPAINRQGELCDRWGTPYFFHALSGTQMEIRSAGPDRQLWTADDEVLTPGLTHPQL